MAGAGVRLAIKTDLSLVRRFSGDRPFCAERLQAHSPELLIERDELDAIRTQCEEVLAKVKPSESLPTKLK
jgi:hypothetical protein